jgi:hypothetical protein
MADFDYVSCPQCHDKFMAGEEFFRLPQAYCHCPYCGNEFRVGVAAAQPPQATTKRGEETVRGKRRT